jgi:parvulin-like peptidyl-prolyl isomerase
LAQTATASASVNSTSDRIPLQVIVVRSNEEAEAILARLRKGEDFGALAKQKSIDPTASDGGFMGTFAVGELRA